MTTIFQKIINREIEATIIYEDKNSIAFLDAFPFEPGHVLVIPKKAYKTIFDMSESEFLDLQRVIFKVANKVRETTKKDIVIIQRNGEDAGQEILHVHFHIIPRYTPEKEKPLFSDDNSVLILKEESKKFKDMFSFDKNVIE